jgi:hypothetical protein
MIRSLCEGQALEFSMGKKGFKRELAKDNGGIEECLW